MTVYTFMPGFSTRTPDFFFLEELRGDTITSPYHALAIFGDNPTDGAVRCSVCNQNPANVAAVLTINVELVARFDSFIRTQRDFDQVCVTNRRDHAIKIWGNIVDWAELVQAVAIQHKLGSTELLPECFASF